MSNIENQKTTKELEEELKKAKLELEIAKIKNNNVVEISQSEKEKLINKGKKMTISAIVTVIAFICCLISFIISSFTISSSSPTTFIVLSILFWIVLIALIIQDIIWGVQILSTDWKNDELNNSKTLWGILCFIVLGAISAIVFGSMVTKKLSK